MRLGQSHRVLQHSHWSVAHSPCFYVHVRARLLQYMRGREACYYMPAEAYAGGVFGVSEHPPQLRSRIFLSLHVCCVCC